MRKSTYLLALFSAALLFVSACEENSKPHSPCIENPNTPPYCQGNTAYHCGENSELVAKDCGADICENGECIKPATCDPAVDAPKCDGNVAVTCDNNKIKRQDCGEDICENGACVPNTNCDPAVDAPKCDGNVAVTCDNNKIKRQDCGEDICENGVCTKPASCDPKVEVPKCEGNVLVTCVGGVTTRNDCGDNTCIDGACVAPATCDPKVVKPYCEDGKTAVTCENGVIVKKTCLSDQVCETDRCSAADCEDPFTPRCVENNRVRDCGSNGKILYRKCANYEICEDGECISDCDPDTFEPVCRDKKVLATDCVNGEFVTQSCGTGLICKDGGCFNEQSEDLDIGAKCNSTFEAHCRGSKAIECSANRVTVRDDCSLKENHACAVDGDLVGCSEICTVEDAIDKACVNVDGTIYAQAYKCTKYNEIFVYFEEKTEKCDEDCKDGECVDYVSDYLGKACIADKDLLCERDMNIECNKDENVYELKEDCTKSNSSCVEDQCYKNCNEGDPDLKSCFMGSNNVATQACVQKEGKYIYQTSGPIVACKKPTPVCRDGVCVAN
ncbi:MAG: hypothetical protein ACOX8U_02125 [Bradymonadia bacterium]|jgi:hypothetical protein